MPSQDPLLLGLHAETSLHAGAGASLGVIDLPIQREAHTGYPVVYGSAVKGALRAHASAVLGKVDGKDHPTVTVLFGPAKVANDDSAHAGALLVGDARLVALPIRSLTSQFKWVTCKYLLDRLFRDAGRLGIELGTKPEMKEEPRTDTLFAAADAKAVYLEEYRFGQKARADMIEKAAAVLAGLSAVPGAENALKEQLVIVRDDDFAHLVRAAVPVTPHVALESASKTTKDGALWYEETLPPETLLYVPIVALKSRCKDAELTAENNVKSLRNLFEKPRKEGGKKPALPATGRQRDGWDGLVPDQVSTGMAERGAVMSALIEQQRARFALDRVAQWKKENKLTDKLKPAADSLPALILMNGLGQAAAYAKSQEEHWWLLYDVLSDWLCGKRDEGQKTWNAHPVYPKETDLLAGLTRGDMADYRAAQAEALAFLQWLKNAVRAEMAGV